MPYAIDLLRLFYANPEADFTLHSVPTTNVPSPYDRLLVHHNHMTVTVESFYETPVDVHVLDVHSTERHYARKIQLKKQSDGIVVQFGIVRLDRDLLPDDVWQEIEAQQAPLGRVLIEKNVLRHVELVSTWRVSPSAELTELLGGDNSVSTYGRTARIHVNDVPAVELLEIVAPVEG